MKVTKKMIEACAAEMAKCDWLPEHWDKDIAVCHCCNQPLPSTSHRAATKVPPDDIRAEIRTFLEAALEKS